MNLFEGECQGHKNVEFQNTEKLVFHTFGTILRRTV